MVKRHFWQYFVVAGLALSISVSAAQAQNKGLDPFVERLIQVTSDYLASADVFQIKAEVTYDEVLNSGKKLQMARLVEVMVRRPNRLRVELLDESGTQRFYYDGETFSKHHINKNAYAIVDAPNSIDKLIDMLRTKYGIALPLGDLLISDPAKSIRDNADSGIYAGLHFLQGVKHHHLLLSNQNVDFQIWIEDSARPVPKKIVITYRNKPGQPQITAILNEWDFAPRLPDLVFDFAPPIDAIEIEVLPIANVDR